MLKNKILYLFFISYTGVLAILYNRVQTLHAFIVIFGVAVGMFLLSLYFRNKVSAKVVIKQQMGETNKEVPYQIVITNECLLPAGCVRVWLQTKNEFDSISEEKKVNVSVPGNATTVIEGAFKTEYAGIVTISIKKSRVYDYLRIFARKVKICESQSIAIMPQINDIQDEIILNTGIECEDSNKFSYYKPGDDPSEVYGIREYQPGDKMQRIHWKLSSKSETVLVKEYSLPIDCSVAILFDRKQSNNNLKDTHHLLEMLFSLSNYFIKQNVVHTISWYQAQFKDIYQAEILETEDFYEAMHECLHNNFNDQNKEIDLFLEKNEQRMISNLFYITNKVDDAQIKQLREAYPNARIQIMNVCGKEEKKEIKMTYDDEMHYNWIDAEDMKHALDSLVLS